MRRGLRRPLVALIVLVLALVIGYTVKAADSRGMPVPPGARATQARTP